MLITDLDAPRKQRHTIRRIFNRLVEEHEMEGISYATACDWVAVRRPQAEAEAVIAVPAVFIAQSHRPGVEAEADGRVEIARHERLATKGASRLELDHYLEALLRKPGATALEQARVAGKFLRAFNYDANPNIEPAVIAALAPSEWVRRGHPLCLIGDSGTGKSHLLISLGTEAARAGFRVRYVLAAKLVNELVEAADDMQLTKTIVRYGRVDLLCIDELGYMELDKRGVELLFQVLTEREETNSVAIVDPRLCAAIVDRLTFNGTIIETGTDSYRLAHTRARQIAPNS